MKTSAVIITPEFSAFIDGIKQDHTCNDNGDLVYESQSGKRIYWYTYKQWAGYTTDARDRLIHEYHLQIDDPIRSCSVTCSICKQAYIDHIMWD